MGGLLVTAISRRSFLGRATASASLPLFLGRGRAYGQATKRPRLHALIIGINAYAGRVGVRGQAGAMTYHQVPQLRGCVNDARAIESAVKPLAATTRLLLDQDVSRAALLGAWQSMVAGAAEGDVLLVTYSGHGGQELGAGASHTADGLHDTFILQAFDSSSPELNAERLLDDEAQGLWKSVQGRNTVVFVADSCFSGGMTRSVDLRVESEITYRTVHRYDVEGDLSGSVAIPNETSGLELPHVVFLSGAQYNECVPELRINGRYQGALSVAFAEALAGRADADRNGEITVAELSSYVLRSIRAISDSSQHPEIRWPHADVRTGIRPGDPLFFLADLPVSALTSVPASATDMVRLKIRGTSDEARETIGRNLIGVILVGPSEPADLTWDGAAQDVLDNLGNILASRVPADRLQPVVNTRRAIAAVRRMIINSGLDMRLLLPGESAASEPSRASDRTHRKGTRLTLVANCASFPYFVLFNIAGNGTIELLFPDSNRNETVDTRKPYELDFEVREPFGADHAIGIASTRALPELVAVLKDIDGKQKPEAAVEAVARHATGADVIVGMQGIFTTDN